MTGKNNGTDLGQMQGGSPQKRENEPQINQNSPLVEGNPQEPAIEEEPEPQPHQLKIEVSQDRMSAFLKVLSLHNPEPLLPETVMEKLKEEKVDFGIRAEEIERFCAGKKYFIKCKVAAGVAPIRGEDGSVEYFFDTSSEYRPKEDEKGNVDFKYMGFIQNVEVNQLLCTLTPPTEGTEGMDVFSQTIEPKPGRMPDVTGGKNTYLSEDQLNIYAKAFGSVRLKRNCVEVDDVWVVRGDVGSKTGNIDFGGTVEISGNVLEGFEVKARDDIIVRGFVEGATLISGRNVAISEGFNGMKKGVIKAVGDVSCKFIETGSIYCGGVFFCDVALNSNVQAGKQIMLKGKRASLIGGEYVSGEGIIANNIGSEMNIPVHVSISPRWEEKEKNLELEMKNLDREIEQILLRREEMKKFDDPSETLQQKTIAMQKLISRVQLLQSEKLRLEKELYKVQLQQDDGDYKIICKGQIFSGVRLMIGSAVLKVNRTLSHQCFYTCNGEIISGQILPTDDSGDNG